MAGEEKTEKATPKKRKDTRKKGEVLQSKEVAVAVFVVGIFAFLAIFGNYMFQMLLNFMEQSMSSIDKTGNTVNNVKEDSQQQAYDPGQTHNCICKTSAFFLCHD